MQTVRSLSLLIHPHLSQLKVRAEDLANDVESLKKTKEQLQKVYLALYLQLNLMKDLEQARVGREESVRHVAIA